MAPFYKLSFDTCPVKAVGQTVQAQLSHASFESVDSHDYIHASYARDKNQISKVRSNKQVNKLASNKVLPTHK